MPYTLAITTYNRFDLLLESFADVVNDNRIGEVLIVDDHSDPQYWNQIKDLDKFNPKIRVIRQAINRGMSVNKRDAVAYSKYDRVILFDSDNIIKPDYLDAIPNEAIPSGNVIYCPSWAQPDFDFRSFAGAYFDGKKSAKMIAESAAFNTMMNACNYVVPKHEYIRVWQENKDMKGSDTIWFNYLWLKAGNKFYVPSQMHYFHRVHKESGFLKDMSYNMVMADKIKKLIQCL